MFHDLVQNPVLSIVMCVSLLLLGMSMIYPPSKIGINNLGILDYVVAQEDDHWTIRTIKGALGTNFIVSAYMWVAPPLVIETDLSQHKTLFFGTIPIRGRSEGPIIWVHDGLHDHQRAITLRHEYQHYCQTTVLTPLGTLGLVTLERLFLFIRYKGNIGSVYYNQSLERNARKYQSDGLEFNHILWIDGELSFVRPLLEVQF